MLFHFIWYLILWTALVSGVNGRELLYPSGGTKEKMKMIKNKLSFSYMERRKSREAAMHS
jgi:hypothetical protein